MEPSAAETSPLLGDKSGGGAAAFASTDSPKSPPQGKGEEGERKGEDAVEGSGGAVQARPRVKVPLGVSKFGC